MSSSKIEHSFRMVLPSYKFVYKSHYHPLTIVISTINHRIQPPIRQLNAIDWGPHPVRKPWFRIGSIHFDDQGNTGQACSQWPFMPVASRLDWGCGAVNGGFWNLCIPAKTLPTKKHHVTRTDLLTQTNSQTHCDSQKRICYYIIKHGSS